MQIGHIGMVSIELVKEVLVGAGSPEEKTMPVKYQLLIPLATKWDDAEVAFDELREELRNMRTKAAEREDAAKQTAESSSAELSVESEVSVGSVA